MIHSSAIEIHAIVIFSVPSYWGFLDLQIVFA